MAQTVTFRHQLTEKISSRGSRSRSRPSTKQRVDKVPPEYNFKLATKQLGEEGTDKQLKWRKHGGLRTWAPVRACDLRDSLVSSDQSYFDGRYKNEKEEERRKIAVVKRQNARAEPIIKVTSSAESLHSEDFDREDDLVNVDSDKSQSPIKDVYQDPYAIGESIRTGHDSYQDQNDAVAPLNDKVLYKGAHYRQGQALINDAVTDFKAQKLLFGPQFEHEEVLLQVKAIKLEMKKQGLIPSGKQSDEEPKVRKQVTKKKTEKPPVPKTEQVKVESPEKRKVKIVVSKGNETIAVNGGPDEPLNQSSISHGNSAGDMSPESGLKSKRRPTIRSTLTKKANTRKFQFTARPGIPDVHADEAQQRLDQVMNLPSRKKWKTPTKYELEIEEFLEREIGEFLNRTCKNYKGKKRAQTSLTNSRQKPQTAATENGTVSTAQGSIFSRGKSSFGGNTRVSPKKKVSIFDDMSSKTPQIETVQPNFGRRAPRKSSQVKMNEIFATLSTKRDLYTEKQKELFPIKPTTRGFKSLEPKFALKRFEPDSTGQLQQYEHIPKTTKYRKQDESKLTSAMVTEKTSMGLISKARIYQGIQEAEESPQKFSQTLTKMQPGFLSSVQTSYPSTQSPSKQRMATSRTPRRTIGKLNKDLAYVSSSKYHKRDCFEPNKYIQFNEQQNSKFYNNN